MKVSKKAYYGLRAVLALAQSEKPLSIQHLRRAGLVEATKGTSGGYALARAKEDTNVWEVLRELDGPIKTFAAPIKGTLPCLQPSHCQTNEVWRKLETEIESTLTRITLDSLIPENHPHSH